MIKVSDSASHVSERLNSLRPKEADFQMSP